MNVKFKIRPFILSLQTVVNVGILNSSAVSELLSHSHNALQAATDYSSSNFKKYTVKVAIHFLNITVN